VICSRTNASRAMSRRSSSIMFTGRPAPSDCSPILNATSFSHKS
jgi:hypothetical protein